MSDFLDKLKAAVDSGKQNDAIKAGFDEILAKADQHAASAESMKAIQEKAQKLTEEAGKENAKKLTLEEVKKLNELAKLEEERMLEKEQDYMANSAIVAVDDKIERLEAEIKTIQEKIKGFEEKKKSLLVKTTFEQRKKLIEDVIAEINGEVV